MDTHQDSILDLDLAAAGMGRIAWARQHMPALTEATRIVSESGAIEGRHVGVVLTLEPKTACLSLSLKAAGASVSVFSAGPFVSDEVAAALAASGVAVFARSDADRGTRWDGWWPSWRRPRPCSRPCGR